MSIAEAGSEHVMRIEPCDAYGPISIPIADLLTGDGTLDLNPEISAKDYFSVSVKKGTLTLRAGGYVGLIPLNDRLAVQVAPRVPVGNLTRILEVSGEAPIVLASTRTYETAADWTDALLDIYADQLLQGVERMRESGFIREYRRREEVSSFPRGRVLVHRTVQQQVFRGVNHRANHSWHERTLDVPANRCIYAAINALIDRYVRINDVTRERRILLRRLSYAHHLFEGVSIDHHQRYLSDPVVSGAVALPAHRAHYREALETSKAIIEQKGVSIERGSGPLRMPSIVANMNYVFEAYIRRTLEGFAVSKGWSEVVLDGNKSGKRPLFDNESPHDATPDVVVEPDSDSRPLVIEVKNVPVKKDTSDRSHINQALAYAMAYRARRVVLVHPRSDTSQSKGLRLQGRVKDVAVYLYLFDLNADDLEAEEREFGVAVRGLLDASREQAPELQSAVSANE